MSLHPGIGTGIMVIEDEPHVQELVVKTLRQAGFRAEPALSRGEIFNLLDTSSCAAIVLDLGLPGDDGISIAHAVRKRSDIPILMLTGRAGIHARVAGLEAGADDYLIKPFAPEELVARLRAILRRALKPASTERPALAIHLGSARLDLASGEVHGPRGHARLTSREANLLLALSRSDGPLSREATYREVFQRDWDPGDRSLDVHIANLRRKLEKACVEPTVIAAVRGSGYELRVSTRIDTGEAPSFAAQDDTLKSP